MAPAVPPPDSPEANKLGCKCPVAANGNGDGRLIEGVREFTINPACPVHSDPRAWFSRRPRGLATGLRHVAVAIAGALLLGTASAAETPYPELPDPGLTPGAVASTDAAEVCGIVDGMTYSQRHRATTPAVKRAVFARYGRAVPTPEDRPNWEIDHRLPLALGGADIVENLWPQYALLPFGYHVKDRLEDAVFIAVCHHHRMTLGEAQAIFLAPDWRVPYCQIIGGPLCAVPAPLVSPN